jgi:hypothetical protein
LYVVIVLISKGELKEQQNKKKFMKFLGMDLELEELYVERAKANVVGSLIYKV